MWFGGPRTPTSIEMVAIKLLPEGFATDAERLQRFEREARLLASLNHTHIATIHGLHEAGTPEGPVRFLAMELVEGEDLAERSSRGQLPIERAAWRSSRSDRRGTRRTTIRQGS